MSFEGNWHFSHCSSLTIVLIFDQFVEETLRIPNLFKSRKNLDPFRFYGLVRNRFLRSVDRASGAAPMYTITLKQVKKFKLRKKTMSRTKTATSGGVLQLLLAINNIIRKIVCHMIYISVGLFLESLEFKEF